MIDLKDIETPFYVVYEDRLRRNLSLISRVAAESGAKIIMAFKANALWKTFGVFREYGFCSAASSVNEMRLGNEEFGCKTHTYCPVYTPQTMPKFLEGSSHITFNSVAQFERFKAEVERHNFGRGEADRVSCGLRINPMCSVVDTGIYDPCSPGSRFGVTAEQLTELPAGIEGFHFHALCESTSYDLARVLESVEKQFGKYFSRLKWINMGGGHLMTKAGYDTKHLVSLLKEFKHKYPNLEVILEPGSAFCWQTGDLVAQVLDVVENSAIKTAIVDTSFACHMPDCLEMPYKPQIIEALEDVTPSKPTYRFGGNTCLSGDFVGDWSFDKPLCAGDRVTFGDMNHYTTVKTNMFNGVQHPKFVFAHADGSVELLRTFTYEDYKSRMD